MSKFCLILLLFLVSIAQEIYAFPYNNQPPSNVALEATSSTSIVIRWQPPPVEDRNEQITGYKIYYRKDWEPLQEEITPPNAQHWELTGLERFSAYRVKIATMTVNGTGPFTKWHHIATNENDPHEAQIPGKPASMKMRPGVDSLTVKWTPPSDQKIKVRSYVLGWGKGSPDEETTEIEGLIRTYEIRNLEPNTEYVISLRASNTMGDGPRIFDTVQTRKASAI